jgi:hypothetical protein
MKKNLYPFTFFSFCLFFINAVGLAQSVGDYQTNGNVTFASSANWQRYNGSAFVAAVTAPSSADGVITIRSGHTATVTNAVNLDQVVIESGGTLDYSGGTLSIVDGAGDDLIIFGTFKHNKTAAAPYAPSATILVKTGGVLEIDNNTTAASHYMTSSQITYETNAICFWNVSLPFSSSGQTFFPNSTNSIPIFRTVGIGISVGGSGDTTIKGILEVIAGANDLTWQGTGRKIFRNGIIGTGNVIQNSDTGQFQITGINAKLGGTGSINLNANGLLISSTAEVTMTSDKPIGVQGGTPTFTVDGILDCATFNLTNASGTPNFTLNADATLKIGSPNGITTSGATGNIQLNGTRTYNSGANYEYKGTTAQVTGNGLPTTLTATLTINNNSGVTQSNASHTINGGQMILTAGTYNLNGKSFTWQNSNTPITRTTGTLTTNNTTNLTFNGTGNSFTLPNDLFANNPTSLNNFTVDRTNDLALGNQNLAVVGTLSVGASAAGDLDLNGNNIDLGNTGTLSENRSSSRVVIDKTATRYDAQKGGYIRVTNRNLNGTDIGGLGIDITNGTAGTVNIDRYHCKVQGQPVESIKKVFDITASVAANNATMQINYSPQDLVGTSLSDGTANFRLHRGKNGVIEPWIMQNSPAAIASCHNTTAKTVFADNINSFSPWSAAPEFTILPVTWLSFVAKKQSQNFVELAWQVSNEVNNKGFEVEKSEDGKVFSKIGEVKCLRKTIELQSYRFLDKLTTLMAFYRIKQIDLDGKVSYSKIVAVQTSTENDTWEITPNPIVENSEIHTSLLPNTVANYQIVTASGSLLQTWQGEISSLNSLLINYLQKISQGIYFVNIQTESFSSSQKIVKE